MKNKIIFLTGGAILLIAGAIFFNSNRSSQNQTSSTPQGNLQVQPTITPEGQRKIFKIEGQPFFFSVKEIKVKKGEIVRIEFTSKVGTHDFVLDEFNVRTKQLSAGQSDSVEFVADKTGTFEYYCSVANHRQMGMVGKLIVEE